MEDVKKSGITFIYYYYYLFKPFPSAGRLKVMNIMVLTKNIIVCLSVQFLCYLKNTLKIFFFKFDKDEVISIWWFIVTKHALSITPQFIT